LRLRLHFGAILLAAVISYISFNAWSLNSDVEKLGQKAEILNKQLAQRQAENAQLKKELTELQSDEYVEKVAREQLGLIRRGEIPYWTGPQALRPNSADEQYPPAPSGPVGQPGRVH